MVTHPPPVVPGTAAPYSPAPPYVGAQQPQIPFAAPVIPYATPANLTAAQAPAEAAWQDGPMLVVRKGVILPPLCVKCGGPAEGNYYQRTFWWHHPALYLMILFPGLLIYAIVACCVREQGKLALHLCAAHRRRRLTMIWTSCALAFAGLAAIFDGVASDVPWIALAGGTLVVGSLYIAATLPLLKARRIDSHFMWLGGAAPAFLNALPSLPRRW